MHTYKFQKNLSDFKEGFFKLRGLIIFINKKEIEP